MKLTEDEIKVENMMSEVTGEITNIYIDRSYRCSNSYTAKLPNYIIEQGVALVYYNDSALSVRTKTGNNYTIELSGLGTSEYLGESSLHVEEWDTQKVIYED